MDTSDSLASSLSLAVFLLAFAYLCLVESSASPASRQGGWPGEQTGRVLYVLRSLRLACVVAVVLSVLALLLGHTSPGIGTISPVALGLLAFLLIVDVGARFASSRYPAATLNLSSPLIALLRGRRSFSRSGDAASVEPGFSNGKGHNGEALDILDSGTEVLTLEEQASLDDRERLMIRSILRLDDTMSRGIMVPRVDIIAVEDDASLTEVATIMMNSGHSRLPVYTETIDNIVGVVHARDLLPFLDNVGAHPPLEKIMRDAFFIPESKRLDDLLRELQERRTQIALVVDEYGGIEGLVTLEDLLEEIVGEIEDEFSRSREPRLMPTDDGHYMVDAGVTLDELSGYLSTPIGNEDVDTIGGLVYSALGKIPETGDEVVHDGFRIKVVSVLGRRIRRLELSRALPEV